MKSDCLTASTSCPLDTSAAAAAPAAPSPPAAAARTAGSICHQALNRHLVFANRSKLQLQLSLLHQLLLLLNLLLLFQCCQSLAVALPQPTQRCRSLGFSQGRPVGDAPQAAVCCHNQWAQLVQR